MTKAILICSCYGQAKKAAEAFSLLFPNVPIPEIHKGRDRVMKFAMAQDNDHLRALAKLSGKYMYYVELEDGKIIKEYDLTHGQRIA